MYVAQSVGDFVVNDLLSYGERRAHRRTHKRGFSRRTRARALGNMCHPAKQTMQVAYRSALSRLRADIRSGKVKFEAEPFDPNTQYHWESASFPSLR